MKTGNRILESKVASLQRDYLNPNTSILPIPEKMDEEEFLSILHIEEDGLLYHLKSLREESSYLDYCYKDGKITDKEYYEKHAEINEIAQLLYERL
jgi:hypothetical protein